MHRFLLGGMWLISFSSWAGQGRRNAGYFYTDQRGWAALTATIGV
jgi:hypothetical protein